MTLVEKYRPKNFQEVKDQKEAKVKLKRFVENFPKKKSLMLYGPAGTGKTTLVHALAGEYKSEILEMNASDLRNKKQIQGVFGHASQQKSLFSCLSKEKKKVEKILLVDEVDGISRKDYGGLSELLRLIKETSFPIIITSNDPWDHKFSKLRRKVEMVEVKSLDYKTIFSLLKEITEKEEMKINEELLKSVAIKARGDLRAAINDLQTLGEGTQHHHVHERDKEEKIFDVLKQILQAIPNPETLRQLDKVNLPIDDIFLWMEENIPKEYKGEEIYKAFDMLSKADVFRGRIMRQQHWRFLVYENFLLSAGICSVKKKAKYGFTKYQKPGRILKIWLSNRKQKYKKSICEKYAEHTHISTKRAMREFGIIKELLKNTQAREELELEQEEVEFLNKIY